MITFFFPFFRCFHLNMNKIYYVLHMYMYVYMYHIVKGQLYILLTIIPPEY